MILTAISLGGTGLVHTVLKNRQLEVKREIERVDRRLKEKERDVTNLEIRIGQMENRWDLRNALVAAGTELRGIPLEAIEDISTVGVLPEMAKAE
ncbi:hypothetical protein [Roseibacillus ishigakijimensis]|nr:hypothetical protein [Roseibacillus ishigakijimensis]